MIPSLTRFAWVAVAAAVVVIGLKVLAYLLTGSVGLLSDAAESVANLLGALMALAMLALASRPPDEDHAYGHTKAEYFAIGFEGALIVIAAVAIGTLAVGRLLDPRPIEAALAGLSVAAVASVVNFGVARFLVRAATRHGSLTLEASARHLMADVWTSVGVIVGVGLAVVTGWLWIDAAVALGVALHIVVSGWTLLQRSALGLMDTALPVEERGLVDAVLKRHEENGVRFHAVRTRVAGRHRFVSMHVLVPGEWTVQRGHELLEAIEREIHEVLPSVSVFTHLEPLEDPASWADARLDRPRTHPPAG